MLMELLGKVTFFHWARSFGPKNDLAQKKMTITSKKNDLAQ